MYNQQTPCRNTIPKHRIARRKLIYGFGVNDADYPTAQTVGGQGKLCPFYYRWRGMIRTCYYIKASEAFTVREEWLTFSNFAEWMKCYDWPGKVLVQDLIDPSSKTFSPETCMLVPLAIRNLTNPNAAIRGNYSRGVRFNKQESKFSAAITIHGKAKHLGCFITPEEAQAAYSVAKCDYILSLLPSLKGEDPRLIPALQRVANDLIPFF